MCEREKGNIVAAITNRKRERGVKVRERVRKERRERGGGRGHSWWGVPDKG